ncbi:MAG: hypothetical protein MRY83_03570 [Flavobacteriales bacterium]|nr:hypothetical protein [Flavobacteriales bacterium]
MISVVTVLWTQEFRVNFKVGFPFTFYYQFLIDCEVQHGSDGPYLLLDMFITWLGTLLIYYSYQYLGRSQKPKGQWGGLYALSFVLTQLILRQAQDGTSLGKLLSLTKYERHFVAKGYRFHP